MGLEVRGASLRNLRVAGDGAVLAIAFLLVPRMAMGTWLDPVPAIIGLVLGAICVRGADAPEPVPWRRQIAVQGCVCAAVALIWCWLYRLPIGVLGFAPVWVALSAALSSALSIAASRANAPAGETTQAASSQRRFLHRAAGFLRGMSAALLVGTAPPVLVYGILAMLVPGFAVQRHEALVIATAIWIAAWALAFWRLRWLDSLAGSLLPLVSASLLLLASMDRLQGGPGRLISVWFLWSALLAVCYRCAARSATRPGPSGDLIEAVRLLLIFGLAVLLMKGFLSPNLLGTGDSKWYATMLEDAVLQTRVHGFPVWAGESPYQFNGAIYPLRVAPAFHHLGALLDLATLRALPPITLMNLLLLAVGVSAAFTTYYAAAMLLGARRWAAAAIAIIYLACPGVLELSYNSDLYMSWMTVPFVPVAFFAAARNATKPGWRPTLILAWALGLCWWGHSPIALWTTAAVFLIQVVGFLINQPPRNSLVILGIGALMFVAVAAYPLGSVLLFPPEPGAPSGDWQRASVPIIVSSLRQAFPAVLLPASPKGLMPGNYQLGYTLWAVFIASLIYVRRLLKGAGVAALAVAAGVILLLYPTPGLQEALWTLVPAFVRNITGNHPAGRLYLELSSATLVAGAMLLSSAPARAYRAALFVLLLGAGWSVWQANNFSPPEWVFRHTSGPDTSTAIMRTENVMVTRFAHIIFHKVPANYSDGVVAPELEYRLLRRGDYATLVDGKDAAADQSRSLGVYDFMRAEDGLPWLELPQPIALSPGKRYILSLEANAGSVSATGILQIKGSSTLREYLLPAMGGDRAFGLGGSHSPHLPIWTSAPEGETVQVRFIPQGMTVDQADRFARVRFGEYDAAALPVQVAAWMPYRARVQTGEACWFETPRDFQVGYKAFVNGLAADAAKSPDGLVMIPVPSGASEVEVRYVAPLGLRALFLLSALSISCLTVLIFAGRAFGDYS
jgi:hypothetical protein